MKIDFNNWNLGEKIIFVASCIVASSFFLPWIDIGVASRNGFSQGMFLLGGLFVYPVLKLLNSMVINKKIAIACGLTSVLSGIIYISHNNVKMLNESVNVSGAGAYVFLLASIAFLIGVIKYKTASISKLHDNSWSMVGLEQQESTEKFIDKVHNALNFLVNDNVKQLINKHKSDDESLNHLFERALNSLEHYEEMTEKLTTLTAENEILTSNFLKYKENDEGLEHLFERTSSSLTQHKEMTEKLTALTTENEMLTSYFLKYKEDDESLEHLFERASSSLTQHEEMTEKLTALTTENEIMKSYLLKIRKKTKAKLA